MSEARFKALEARLAALEERINGGGPSVVSGGASIASDDDLDGEFGNPIVKKDPKRWDGDSFAGSRMSECPPDYLRTLASFYDWQAGKDEEQGKTYKARNGQDKATAPLRRKDAALARGWAKRNANQTFARPEAPANGTSYGATGTDDSEVPF